VLWPPWRRRIRFANSIRDKSARLPVRPGHRIWSFAFFFDRPAQR